MWRLHALLLAKHAQRSCVEEHLTRTLPSSCALLWTAARQHLLHPPAPSSPSLQQQSSLDASCHPHPMTSLLRFQGPASTANSFATETPGRGSNQGGKNAPPASKAAPSRTASSPAHRPTAGIAAGASSPATAPSSSAAAASPAGPPETDALPQKLPRMSSRKAPKPSVARGSARPGTVSSLGADAEAAAAAAAAEAEEAVDPELEEERQLQQEARQEAIAQLVFEFAIVKASAGDFDLSDWGKWFELHYQLVLEALPIFYTDGLALAESPSGPKEKLPLPDGAEYLKSRGGSVGLMAEFVIKRAPAIMLREIMLRLFQIVRLPAEDRPRHIYLDGRTGAGKSVTMAAMVHDLRQCGWVVLYVPSAHIVVDGASYFTRSEVDGLVHTPDIAKLLLRGLLAVHRDELFELDTLGPEQGGTEGVLPLIREGLATENEEEPTQKLAEVMRQLRAAQAAQFCVAVDDYNALYAYCGYHEWLTQKKRVMIPPGELALVKLLRILEVEAGPNQLHIAAPTFGPRMTDRMPLPVPADIARDAAHVPIQRFSLPEWTKLMDGYDFYGAFRTMEHTDTFEALFHLTQGNPRELMANLSRLHPEMRPRRVPYILAQPRRTHKYKGINSPQRQTLT